MCCRLAPTRSPPLTSFAAQQTGLPTHGADAFDALEGHGRSETKCTYRVLADAVSTLHCMAVSLAEGGAGLGTVWGEEVALDMLHDAGFVDISVHEVPGDPLDSLYVAHKPA